MTVKNDPIFHENEPYYYYTAVTSGYGTEIDLSDF